MVCMGGLELLLTGCNMYQMVNATITQLPLEHSLRRLLTPFPFRTTYVNNRARSIGHLSFAAIEGLMRSLEF
eukprot:2227236-Rhodomonas_salina.1